MSERVVLTRTYDAAIEDVWEMWTTREGIESWWGPGGFRVEVETLELRPGGKLAYAMIASAPDTIAFMKRAGMPTAQPCHARYTVVEAPTRLAYLHSADFIPGVEPYEVATEVRLERAGDGTALTLTFERMHDAEWTNRATMGWESELGKLDQALRAR